jgi:hypothetical protein
VTRGLWTRLPKKSDELWEGLCVKGIIYLDSRYFFIYFFSFSIFYLFIKSRFSSF